MFLDDLIVVTKVSRDIAKACKICLSIYIDLTGQTPNVSKSSIHIFPVD